MLTRNKRIITAILIIFSISNLVYLFVIFNPQITVTQAHLQMIDEKVLTTLPGAVESIKVYDNIIYGIYFSGTNKSQILFGYSDHFIFETPIQNGTSSQYVNIISINKTGIFVDRFIDTHIILLYNFEGQLFGLLDNPVHSTTTPYFSPNFYSFKMTQTNDAIYRISMVWQQPLPLHYQIYCLDIEGWKTPISTTSRGLVKPDFTQTIYLNDSNLESILNLGFQHTSTSDTMQLLLSQNTKDINKMYFLNYQLNLNGIKTITSKEILDTTGINLKLFTYQIISGIPFKVYYPYIEGTYYRNQILVANLETEKLTNLTGSIDYSSYGISNFDSNMALFGGGKVNNNVVSSLILFSVQNKRLVSNQVLKNPLNTEIDPIYYVVISDKDVYLITGPLHATSAAKYQLMVFSNAIQDSLFISTIDPGLQLNALGLFIALIFTTVVYIRYRNFDSKHGKSDLSYPENPRNNKYD